MFSAILCTFGLVTSERCSVSTCSFGLNVANTSFYTHTRNKKNLIRSFDQFISQYIERSEKNDFWALCLWNNPETRTFDCMWFSAKRGRHNPILNSENHKMLITIFRDISQKVSFSAILGTFWLVASEAEGFLACHIRLNVVHTRLNILTRNKKHLI